MKVLFTTCFLSPYRIDFFNELGKYCDLSVVAEDSIEHQKHRDKAWFTGSAENFKQISLHSIRLRKKVVFCPGIAKFIGRGLFDVVVIGGCSTPTELYAHIMLKLRGVPFILNSDGALPGSQESKFRHLAKRWLYGRPSLLLSTGRPTKRYFTQYGVPDSKIVDYPFASQRSGDILSCLVSETEKEVLRKTLGIYEKQMVLSVGRFIHSKGFDVLLEACRNLPADVGVYIIGGNDSYEYSRIREELQLCHVHFVCFKPKSELQRYYQASDLFVLPTRSDTWGLVINEAMSNGLPVITTDKCGAGLELIKDGENGYIVPVGNADALGEKMRRILSDDVLSKRMSQNNIAKIRPYTIENMAKTHMDILQSVLKA